MDVDLVLLQGILQLLQLSFLPKMYIITEVDIAMWICLSRFKQPIEIGSDQRSFDVKSENILNVITQVAQVCWASFAWCNFETSFTIDR